MGEQFLQRPPDVNLLCGAPVDLYQLFTETTGRGGYEQVCTSKQWREIFRQLPQYSQTHTSASYALKKCTEKIFLSTRMPKEVVWYKDQIQILKNFLLQQNKKAHEKKINSLHLKMVVIYFVC